MKRRIAGQLLLVRMVMIIFGCHSMALAAPDGGVNLTSSIWAQAVLEVPGSPVTLRWRMVGASITPSGDQVISGYFYADPNDFAYGSVYNPEMFVKVYIAANGWCNIAFNHVTVDDVTVRSMSGGASHASTATLETRLVEHQYDGVAIDQALQTTGETASPSSAGGYALSADLWARAILQPASGAVNLIWKQVGADSTPSGDRVISGYFYANPEDFAYGGIYNPEIFVKVYIASNGWANIAFNHVTVDRVDISSAHNYGGQADQFGTGTLDDRLIEHRYDGVSGEPINPDTPYNVISVGPGRAHTDLSTIDWPNLQPGDEVRIHWREEPYRSKIGLRSRGTAEAPIRVVGVANSVGDRPVISGIDATTPSSLAGYFEKEWTEGLGVIVIHRGDADDWGYKPGYIEIEGLKIEGGYKEYRYTGMDGQTYNYFDGAGGIWAVLVDHLTVRNCEITDNGNGLFVLSKNNAEAETSRNVLVEKNYIHGNGNIGSDQEHHIYTQVADIVFQYNRIGPLRDGSGGIALKDRSAGTVIRYNWIESGARTLDLVEPEDSYAILTEESGFGDTWVYGNVILNEFSTTHPYAVNMFHYGGDMGETSIYRKGTLHFFQNTVYIRMQQSDEWDVTLFDLSTNDETVEMFNNIFYRDGDSYLYMGRNAGRHVVNGTNWISSGWENSSPDNEWHTFSGTVTVNVAPMQGASPGLTDASNHDFSVSATAAVHDRASALPAALSAHPVDRQYVLHLSGENRPSEGSADDIGAFEHDSGNGSASAGHVTYSYNGRIYRIAAEPGASPEDISAKLDDLSPLLNNDAGDFCLNLSPDGKSLVFSSERGDADCNGWPCLILTDSEIKSIEVVQIGNAVVHPEGCGLAVASGGQEIVYLGSGENGHVLDLYAITKNSGGLWQSPINLTTTSPFTYHGRPSISSDGKRLLFECGNASYENHSVCAVNIDGTGFSVEMAVNSVFDSFRQPDDAPDGTVVFEGETPNEQIWRLSSGSPSPHLVNGAFNNDNSPCVLPDGRIASLWLGREGGKGYHELKIMSADGSSYFMAVEDIDIADIGLGCGY